jgi:hypothetical protein
MRRVILESPYAGEVHRNEFYARLCVRDCLQRNEAPIASHLLYTQPDILRDDVPEERKLGMQAGLSWIVGSEGTVVYQDLGISGGMKAGITKAKEIGGPSYSIEYRNLSRAFFESLSRGSFDHAIKLGLVPR